MTLNDEFDILHKLPFFNGIGPSKLKLLAFASDRIIFKEGQDLFREGDEAHSAVVQLTGEADVLQTSDEGVVKVGEAHPHSIVGEVALLHDQLRASTVTTTSTVETLLISRDNFQKLLANCPGTLSKLLNSLGDKMSKAV